MLWHIILYYSAGWTSSDERPAVGGTGVKDPEHSIVYVILRTVCILYYVLLILRIILLCHTTIILCYGIFYRSIGGQSQGQQAVQWGAPDRLGGAAPRRTARRPPDRLGVMALPRRAWRDVYIYIYIYTHTRIESLESRRVCERFPLGYPGWSFGLSSWRKKSYSMTCQGFNGVFNAAFSATLIHISTSGSKPGSSLYPT